jgi:hypothetical protein
LTLSRTLVLHYNIECTPERYEKQHQKHMFGKEEKVLKLCAIVHYSYKSQQLI